LASHADVVQKVTERFGRLDVLFINAGGGSSLKIEDCTEADWDAMFAMNLKGMYFIVRNTCRTPGPVERSGTFDLVTTPSRSQRRALELIEKITS
jgi:3-oxoacyl-[acyl-carrier protein] reductase